MAYRWLGVMLLSAACVSGCTGDGTGDPRGTGGSGGDGGTAGGGGIGATAGTGGTDPTESCETTALCRSCPDGEPCQVGDDCSDGYTCLDTGCRDPLGDPIRQCVFAGGGACNTVADCPPERDCIDLELEGKRCVKTTPGCATRFDCMPGFTCENGACVDRRVACDLSTDCPKNHTCLQAGFSSFCVRINVSCQNEFDCVGRAPRCEDVDGDGDTECADVVDPNAASPTTCLNGACADPGAPVCETDAAAGATTCGQYGLCLVQEDCAPGFSCVELWPDGRKHCVPDLPT